MFPLNNQNSDFVLISLPAKAPTKEPILKLNGPTPTLSLG